jgi:hypothetical protein
MNMEIPMHAFKTFILRNRFWILLFFQMIRFSTVSLACNLSVQVSLNQEGWAIITPGMLVMDPDFPLNMYTIDIMGPLADTVYCEQIGEEVMAAVDELPTGNTCMSQLHVEDKLKPYLDCSNDTIPCNVDIEALEFTMFLDSLSDNCDEDVSVYYTYTITNLNCDPNGIAGIGLQKMNMEIPMHAFKTFILRNRFWILLFFQMIRFSTVSMETLTLKYWEGLPYLVGR